jgi:hypothetical protein
VVRAKIYPVIKPAINSFVREAATDPAIFLWLDPAVIREKFENIVAHELHHIGLTSAIDAFFLEALQGKLTADAMEGPCASPRRSRKTLGTERVQDQPPASSNERR